MLPEILKIGPLTIYSYGLFLVLGFLLATFVVWKEARKQGYDEEKIFDFILFSSLGAFLLGRAFYIAFNWSYFGQNLLQTILFWQSPGFHLWGICLGFFTFGVYFLKKHRWPLDLIYDLISVGLLIFQTFEKIGLFFSDPNLGKVTTSFLGLTFPNQTVKRYPTAIFEAIFYFTMFLIFYKLYKSNQKKENPQKGLFLNLYLVVVGLSHFIFSFLKEDNLYLQNSNLTLISLAVIMVTSGAILYLRQGRNLGKDFSFITRIFKSREKEGVEDLIAQTKDLKPKKVNYDKKIQRKTR